uniref:Uncharacterized protein n=1 Tax=Oryza glumipatula TaxID=40148 RepID=A0A0E0B6K9_9ORYZ
MGGDHGGHGHGGGDFRQKVWSMTGGPYCRPVHWRRNTAIAMFGVFLVCIPIAMKSAELEFWKDVLTDLIFCSNAHIIRSGRSHLNFGAKTLARKRDEDATYRHWHLCVQGTVQINSLSLVALRGHPSGEGLELVQTKNSVEAMEIGEGSIY